MKEVLQIDEQYVAFTTFVPFKDMVSIWAADVIVTILEIVGDLTGI